MVPAGGWEAFALDVAQRGARKARLRVGRLSGRSISGLDLCVQPSWMPRRVVSKTERELAKRRQDCRQRDRILPAPSGAEERLYADSRGDLVAETASQKPHTFVLGPWATGRPYRIG